MPNCSNLGFTSSSKRKYKNTNPLNQYEINMEHILNIYEINMNKYEKYVEFNLQLKHVLILGDAPLFRLLRSKYLPTLGAYLAGLS